jgi:nucleoside-diphosphate-sugar epimerase
MEPIRVFVTGGTGFIGRALVPQLIARRHEVTMLVRPGRGIKVPEGAMVVEGDALNGETFRSKVRPCTTFVHLVGVSKPGPSKAREFTSVDLASIQASVAAATVAGIRHFVYISVAHPAPVMRAYIDVRVIGETLIRKSGMNATILRPWYVLGPGHRWPYLLIPMYWILGAFPATKDGARRLGLVTLRQIVDSLIRAIEIPPQGVRVLEVPDIRGTRQAAASAERVTQ